MTSPLFNRAIFALTGLTMAILVPAAAGSLTLNWTENGLVAGIVVVVAIYQLMAISVAIGSLWQHIPDSYALGPSLMAGSGLLTLSMSILPLLALPGAFWLFVMPFDEQGYFRPKAMLSLDVHKLEKPYHE